jgi:hypothetical protein
MFHIPAHKQVSAVDAALNRHALRVADDRAFVAQVAAVIAARPESNAQYCAAYAKWSPLMRDRWAGRKDPQSFAYAKAEIAVLLQLHDVGAYVGKLYAELDAIRDREHALSKRRPAKRAA